MIKLIHKGPVPRDDPMFTEGYSIFSVRRYSTKKPSSDELESSTTESSTSESKGNSKPPVTKE